MNSVLRVFSYLKRYPGLAAAQLFCASVMALSVIVFPSIAGFVTDTILPDPARHDELLFWVLLGLGGFFLKDLLNCGRILVNNHFEQNVIYDIRSDLYRKIQNLPLRWFDSRRTGDIMTRVAEDVTSMERVLIDGIELGLVSTIQLLAVGTVMYVINWQVGLWASLPIPFLILGAWIYSKDARHRHRAQRDATSDLNSLLHDNISGIRQIKSYAAEADEHENFNSLSEKVRQATLRLMRWWAVYNPSMSFVQMLGYSLVLYFGGRAVLAGTMDVGDLVTYFLLLSLFYDPISNLRQLNQLFLSSRAAADRVFDILDSEDEPNKKGAPRLPDDFAARVEFRDLSFAYEAGDADSPTLTDLNLQALPGETVALVGPTGAGKSTIVNLLPRFYHYQKGSILIDGHELKDLDKSSLREKIGYVTQEAFLFNGTVRQNLLLARREASDEQLWTALDHACCKSFVEALPQGLDTNVGERGVKLSGGEKQRLSIARALLKDPPILLLDEATASVDTETEHLIQKALDRLMENRTVFVIAHRLSTIKNADRIYVLDQGRVVEKGTHEELLALGGLYSELSKKSFLDEEPA
ncbi:ABC transporter ATP-binding protein [Roseibacillus ishigakijimensis]|uniref:ABC transporter ATP-binding protein n=1 Tax=Roseibacillus ishigakijimensis TaxID=454146 RepID=A0A934RRV8_9BACT|nr:ABC transporter ATP-binding protein [Roseibacillus ishigakijimensis]MBK1833889.1 ABC transporter ATP-binding protein [Roseibacillus ishigakijimensis]